MFFAERLQRQKQHFEEVRQLLEKLRTSEERFSLAMQGANDGLWDWNLTEDTIYLSPRWLGMLGYEPDALSGRPDIWEKLLSPQDLDRFLELLHDYIAGSAESFSAEYRLRHRDGSWVDVLSRALLIRENGKAVRVVGTHVDISDRKRDAEIHQSNALRFREALRVANMAGWQSSNPGEMIWSPEVYELFMLTPEDFGGSIEDFYQFVHPEDRSNVKSAFEVAWANGGHFSCVHRIVLADGSIRVMRESGEPVLDHHGNTVSMSGILQDVTEQSKLEAQLRQALKMEAVGQLTGGLAHDFNNLLTVIQGNAELLSMQTESPSAEVSSINLACERGAQLTHRLLSFSRQDTLQPEPVNICQLIGGMIELFRRTLGETIRIATPRSQSSHYTLADRGQLENALLNLVINARDAMPEGGTLTIGCTAVNFREAAHVNSGILPPGNYAVLSVQDQGTGMSDEVIQHVFEPFFTTKDVGKGTGLGLSMVYGFIRQSGGGIKIQSELGEGTTVSLYLPRIDSDDVVSDASPSTSSTEGHGETILVIEDDSQVQSMTAAMLKTLGYRVLGAEDATSAQQMVDRHPEIALILSDVVLPGGTTGPSFVHNLLKSRPELKAIFMSGYAGRMATSEGLLNVGETLLHKPFRIFDLANAVNTALSGSDIDGSE